MKGWIDLGSPDFRNTEKMCENIVAAQVHTFWKSGSVGLQKECLHRFTLWWPITLGIAIDFI